MSDMVLALDANGAAAACKVSVDTIERARANGHLVGYQPKVGKNGEAQRKWLYRPDDLDAWIRKGAKS